jgi:hypothetical protein
MVITCSAAAAAAAVWLRFPISLLIFCFVVYFFQALPNQQTVNYPSFKLVIVGDGGTGKSLIESHDLFLNDEVIFLLVSRFSPDWAMFV